MANIILFDNEISEHLLPLTFTKPICELRVGILTIREKWEKWLKAPAFHITRDYLAGKYGMDYSDVNYVINGSVLPSEQLCALIRQMDDNEAYLRGDELIVAKVGVGQLDKLIKDEEIDELVGINLQGTRYSKIDRLWDLYQLNAQEIQSDFNLLSRGRSSQDISDSNRIIGDPKHIFVEKGVSMEGVSLNTQGGPIYLGEGAEIMEGSTLRGPLAIGEQAKVMMGTRIYGGTSVGPHCKAGGEINNSILQAYSNKQHDGFLGHSVIGEWCNIGANTVTSNLKNNYEEVKLWNYKEERFVATGSQFCGLIMGDHAKTGINTMLNTGTIIGVGANVFGAGYPRTFIPSFALGGPHGYKTFQIDKAFQMMERMMARRDVKFTAEDRLITMRVFEDTAKHRRWEKK
ncbi:MAG TPA: GlmU family protein [Saprospiraceae bacterium]|nr:GlmU family protein [Saprospiraceae bacterium]